MILIHIYACSKLIISYNIVLHFDTFLGLKSESERLSDILTTVTSVNRFFSFNPGANIFYLRDGTIIPYTVNWKCVSEGITSNLQKLTVLQTNNKSMKHVKVMNQGQLEFVLSAVRHPEGLGNTV